MIQRLPNGNLVVQGQKNLRLNQGDELVQVQGIVRPGDISQDNTIPSSRVAEARIVYGGRGRAVQRDGLAEPLLQFRPDAVLSMAMKLFSSSSWQRRVASFVALMLLVVAAPASAERIKDLAQVGGVRGNALVGYGLVVGLDGSGDRTSQAPFTVQSLKNLLGELGVNVPPNVNPQLKNVAAVAIHAELPPFASRASRSTSPCPQSATR